METTLTPAQATFAAVLAAVNQASTGQFMRYSPQTTRVAKVIKAKIDNEFRRRVSINTLATELRLPAEYMSRYLREELGVSAVEYRAALRVIEAMYALGCGGRPADVCREMGFEEPTTFSKQFSKTALVPPSTFARRGRRSFADTEVAKDLIE